MVERDPPPGVRLALLLGAAAAALHAAPASAQLRSVSGWPAPAVNEVLADGPRANVAYSLANGFPLWYQDQNRLKLELCLDQRVELGPSTSFFPCLTAEPFTSGPISFPTNFGPEAFYWAATAFGTFTSSVGGAPVAGDALLVLAQEAGFATNLAIDGNQAVFGRIRIRISVPVAGTYRVTHPYGQVDYVVTVPGIRAINQTQDVGNLLAGPAGPPPVGDFLAALANGPDPRTLPPPGPPPAVEGTVDVPGVVSSAPTGIGPFLVAAAPLQRVRAPDGRTYLANPGTDVVPITVPVAGGRFGNAFRIELRDPPNGVFLNAAQRSQEIVIDHFQLVGKVFDDRANLAPVAVADFAGTAKGKPVLVDVVANDVDVVRAGNVHGVNPQALGLPSNDPADPAGTILLTRPLTTAHGGKVRRFTEFATGKTTFLYEPAPGFIGVDTFRYVVQDRGGLISAPATVSVTVEDLSVTRAEYRAKLGKWRVAGTTTDTSAGAVRLFGGPRARLTPAVEAAGGSAAAGTVTLRLLDDAIEFALGVAAPSVWKVQIQVGGPGEDGPPIFTLYDVASDGPFPGTRSGRLTDAQRIFGVAQAQAGVDSFPEAIQAVLAGRAYVRVRTAATPADDLRGQLSSPFLGSALVAAGTGSWVFAGKSLASPGAPPYSVNALSANDVWNFGTPLVVR